MLTSLVIGEGRPLVVLPGFGLDSAAMAAAFEPAFAPAGQPIARHYMNLPGAGSPPVEPTSEAVLAAVTETVEAIGPPVLLAGHSYGGYLGAGLARRRPDLVAAMLLVCPGVLIDRARRDLRGVLPSEPHNLSWLDDAPHDLREHLTLAVGHQSAPAARRISHALALRGESDDGYLRELQEHGYRLADEADPFEFTGPVAMLTGRRDRVAGYRAQLSALETSYPAGTFTVMADAGHYLPFEQPEMFVAALHAWLRAAA